MSFSSHLDDPQYWLDRAEAIRALAEGITDDKKRCLQRCATTRTSPGAHYNGLPSGSNGRRLKLIER